MTDGISKIGRSAVEMNSTADKLRNNKAAAEAAADKSDAASHAPANDESHSQQNCGDCLSGWRF